jgi:isopropylmalate/homocitrate/citramalate synthase
LFAELLEFLRICIDAGGTRIQINDSNGVGIPVALSYICSKVKETFPNVPVLIHTHNDSGLAVANTLGAVEGGAEWIDTTVNDLGELGVRRSKKS